MTVLDDLARETRGLLQSHGLTQPRSAWLGEPVNETALAIKLDDLSSNVNEGVIEVDSELIYVRQYDASTKTIIVAPDGRGWDGTTPSLHAAGARVSIEPTFPISSARRAVQRSVGRCYPTVYATETVTFPFNPSVATYPLPGGATDVLSVVYDTWGPSGDWARVTSYNFNGSADVGEYPTGATVTLNCSIPPGQTVKVVVRKAPDPAALDAPGATFTDCGLSATAERAVLMGAAADLIRFVDAAKLSTRSATSNEDALKSDLVYRPAAKLANELEALFEQELLKEQKRLRETFPSTITRRR